MSILRRCQHRTLISLVPHRGELEAVCRKGDHAFHTWAPTSTSLGSDHHNSASHIPRHFCMVGFAPSPLAFPALCRTASRLPFAGLWCRCASLKIWIHVQDSASSSACISHTTPWGEDIKAASLEHGLHRPYAQPWGTSRCVQATATALGLVTNVLDA